MSTNDLPFCENFIPGVVPGQEPDLLCPPGYETAVGCFDPAGYDPLDCASCGMPKSEHIRVGEQEEQG